MRRAEPAAVPTHPKSAASAAATAASCSQRKFLDVVDLATSGFEVKINESHDEIFCRVHVDTTRHPRLAVSPELCPYMGGVWWLRIELPERYPNSSPSVAFVNRIYHPNVEEQSGSICLDVINQTWSPMYNLTETVYTFLGQLLCYPNAQDPMNSEAAALFIDDPDRFRRRVREHMREHASERRAAAEIENATLGRKYFEPDVDAISRRQRRRIDKAKPAERADAAAAAHPSPAASATPSSCGLSASTPGSTPATLTLTPVSSARSAAAGATLPEYALTDPAAPARTGRPPPPPAGGRGGDDDDDSDSVSDIKLDGSDDDE